MGWGRREAHGFAQSAGMMPALSHARRVNLVRAGRCGAVRVVWGERVGGDFSSLLVVVLRSVWAGLRGW